MKIALLLLAIGQCQGGRCPAPTRARPVPMAAKDMSAVNAAKSAILAAGYKLQDGVPPNPIHVADYNPYAGAIRINSWHAYWDDRPRNARINYEMHWNSTPHADHILRHEFGHAELHRAVGADALMRFNQSPPPLPADRVRATVSHYAAMNAADFHAEVFAGLKYGRVFPPDVMNAYAGMMKP